MKKAVITAVALTLVLCLAVGGTLAYLTAKTDPVTNTFTAGDVNITLEETKKDFKMVPGSEIDKDPKVTVVAGSEDCYLFVKIEKSTNLDTYISYAVAEGWIPVAGQTGVYYREAKAGDSFSVLANDKVTVKPEVTKAQMEDAKTTAPTLTFTAYAAQKANLDVATAWTEVSKLG